MKKGTRTDKPSVNLPKVISQADAAKPQPVAHGDRLAPRPASKAMFQAVITAVREEITS